MKIKSNLMVGLGIGVVAVVGLYFLTARVVPSVLVTVSQAGVGTRVSFGDSYVLGERLLAKADGEDKCKVNVFLMDEAGRAVPGKAVVLSGMEGIVENSGVSDGNGRVAFEMVSAKEGQFELGAAVEGVEIPQSVTVTFRN